MHWLRWRSQELLRNVRDDGDELVGVGQRFAVGSHENDHRHA